MIAIIMIMTVTADLTATSRLLLKLFQTIVYQGVGVLNTVLQVSELSTQSPRISCLTSAGAAKPA
jgi:hypothetical protein